MGAFRLSPTRPLCCYVGGAKSTSRSLLDSPVAIDRLSNSGACRPRYAVRRGRQALTAWWCNAENVLPYRLQYFILPGKECGQPAGMNEDDHIVLANYALARVVDQASHRFTGVDRIK